MKYEVGDVLKTKKKHPCGSDLWTVTRTGADYKIKCNECGRTVMLGKDELDKMVKSVGGKEN